jgi:RNA polymerase sigma-70 factor (ECF subfamily)
VPEDPSKSLEPPASPAGAGAPAQLIEQLFRQHNGALVSFLSARLRSEAEAHEVAQEAYVRMLELDRPGMVSFHRAYLFKIAANLAVDRLRKRTVRQHATARELLKDWLSAPSTDRQLLAEEEVSRLQIALAKLPAKTQEVFQRHFLDGETLQEIAVQLELTDRMVRYHLARALAFCRARLGPKE